MSGIDLLLATNNHGKIDELKQLIGEGVVVHSLRDLGLESPEETGSTFAENAILKAVHGAQASRMLAIADDSGIAVEALDGAPGVYSARFAGPDASDAANRALMLGKMQGVPIAQRRAQFVCVIAVAQPDESFQTFAGTISGAVALTEKGSGGFGYDSLFVLDDGRTMAELSSDEKNGISHRAAAMTLALPYVRSSLAIS